MVPIFNSILSPDCSSLAIGLFSLWAILVKYFHSNSGFWGQTPFSPLTQLPAVGEPHCGESGLCWSWGPHWTQWILCPGLGKRNVYWSRMNSYRNLERRLSMELEWGKDVVVSGTSGISFPEMSVSRYRNSPSVQPRAGAYWQKTVINTCDHGNDSSCWDLQGFFLPTLFSWFSV